MSYPAFGKVKTIVLPISSKIFAEPHTIKEYKNLTGIDLSEYLSIDSFNTIKFDAKGACIYIQVLDDLAGDVFVYNMHNVCVPVIDSEYGVHDNDHFLKIGIYNPDDMLLGIEFSIDTTGVVDLDHIKIELTLA